MKTKIAIILTLCLLFIGLSCSSSPLWLNNNQFNSKNFNTTSTIAFYSSLKGDANQVRLVLTRIDNNKKNNILLHYGKMVESIDPSYFWINKSNDTNGQLITYQIPSGKYVLNKLILFKGRSPNVITNKYKINNDTVNFIAGKVNYLGKFSFNIKRSFFLFTIKNISIKNEPSSDNYKNYMNKSKNNALICNNIIENPINIIIQ